MIRPVVVTLLTLSPTTMIDSSFLLTRSMDTPDPNHDRLNIIVSSVSLRTPSSEFSST